MITIKATIDILNGNNDGLTVDDVENNPNSFTLQKTIGSTQKGGNPLLLGRTLLGTNPTLNSSIPFFISGTEEKDLAFNLHASSEIDNITIRFDTYNNNYPTEIEIHLPYAVSPITYHNDDAIFTVKFDKKYSGDYYFHFYNWNSDDTLFRIESISVGLKIDIDKKNMLSYNGIIQKKADEKFPSWGIVSTTGNISFNDTNGEIGDYADDNILIQDLNVNVELFNTLNKKSSKIGSFKTDTWNYENNSREVSVSLKDDLTEWQDIFIEGISYDPRKAESVTAKEIYDYLVGETPAKYNMMSYAELDTITQEILTNTVIPYKLLYDGNLWEQWTKLCEICACHIFKIGNGKTKFVGVDLWQ